MAKSSAPNKPERAAKSEEAGSGASELRRSTNSTTVTSRPAEPAATARRPIDLIEGAKRQLKELIDYPVDGVSGFNRTDDGWKLSITVVELSRIPSSTDVLAEYVVGLNEAGDIVDYSRGRRYFRDQVGEPL